MLELRLAPAIGMKKALNWVVFFRRPYDFSERKFIVVQRV